MDHHTPPTRQRAVVIEDDPEIRSLHRTVLDQMGFEVILTANAPDGIAAVREFNPVITFLDVNMDGMDGFAAATRIRSFSDTYIVMITGLDNEIDIVQGLSAGADDYVLKPFRPRELRARVEAMLRRPRTAAPAPDPTPVSPPVWRPGMDAPAAAPTAAPPTPAAPPAPAARPVESLPPAPVAAPAQPVAAPVPLVAAPAQSVAAPAQSVAAPAQSVAAPAQSVAAPVPVVESHSRVSSFVLPTLPASAPAPTRPAPTPVSSTVPRGASPSHPVRTLTGATAASSTPSVTTAGPARRTQEDSVFGELFAGGEGEEWLRHRDLALHVSSGTVEAMGQTVQLDPAEVALLAALMESGTRVRSTANLVLALRGESYVTTYYVNDADKRAVLDHMESLRRKIGDTGPSPVWIEPVRAVGFRMTAG